MNLVERIKKLNKKEYKLDEFKLCIFIFLCCGIIGYVVEETYDTLYNLKLDKNGFLYGLFLPIYAWGGLLMHAFTKRTKKHPVITMIIIIILSAVLEYLAGYIIFQIWGKQFWSYNDYFMNLNGYICLFSVSAFTLLGMLFVYIIEPLIKKLMVKLGEKNVETIIKLFLIIYLVDNIFSFLVKNKI